VVKPVTRRTATTITRRIGISTALLAPGSGQQRSEALCWTGRHI
jgi:hypothetical protein